jgi:uncharacterized delta-60 repeat protein
VRYLPDGTSDLAFDGDGIVTTDIFGKGDQANAVAVQPDGKIVVAGFATHATGIDSDFALARYNPDGTLDTSFDGDGIVTTDLGTQSDDARALVIQPDGRIVVAGTAGEDIALARYMPEGKLDTSFGNGGTKITNLGFEDVATGVALTPRRQDRHRRLHDRRQAQQRLPARALQQQRHPRHDVRLRRNRQDRSRGRR